MRLVFVSVLLASASLSVGAAEAACDGKAERGCKTPSFERPRKFEPYDSGRVRAGSLPGFVDVGGGTQVRVGGRVRTEYQYIR